MAQSKIEWTERTLNPTMGCSIVSPGCENCYAMKMAYRLAAMGQAGYEGLTRKLESGRIIWTGKINFDIDKMNEAFKRKKPTMFFVDSMSDLFHEDIPFSFIDGVFEIMGWCKQHIFQILTKRPERMLEYYNWTSIFNAVGRMRNVWVGVSVENKKAKSRIDVLRKVNSAIKILSCEPLLEDLGELNLTGINQVIVGGESGPNARPMHPDWVRSLRDQCKDAGVSFFFKQWGEHIHISQIMDLLPDKMIKNWDRKSNRKGFYMVGKKKAGRLLDGVEYNEFPEVKV